MQTPCCGNTLSRLSLRFALPRCPLCRKDIAEEHPAFKIDEVPINRAVAHLVDAHKAKQNQAHAASAPVQPAEPKTKPMLPSGSTVRLHGLNARPELNGLVGTVGDFVEASDLNIKYDSTVTSIDRVDDRLQLYTPACRG